MTEIRVAAPAKINLFLEVLGRRGDGFHELETVFQTLTLADALDVALAAGAPAVALEVAGADLPCDERNLAYRAARDYLALRPLGRVRIRLRKRIPHGAGLGGGSSDAAAVLRALAQLDPQPPEPAAVHALAARLGSDVPFFLTGGTAWAGGRGEVLVPLPDAPATRLTIAMPPAHLPTPAVYAALTEAERGPRPALGAAALGAMAARDPVAMARNRLTGPARRCCPEAAALLDHLAALGLPHLLSGSGAACAVFADQPPLPPGVAALATAFRPRALLDAVD